MDEEYERHVISKFGLELCAPTWWLNRREENDTYLFWDEYTGSFRLTPIAFASGTDLNKELDQVEAKEAASNPERKKFGDRAHVCYIQENPKPEGGITRSHFYFSTLNGLLLVCSFSYDKELLEDEFSADQVDAALEEVDLILDSIAVFSENGYDDDAP